MNGVDWGVTVLKLALLFFAGLGVLQAHVGSPDVFFQGKAGPYPLLVAIRPPDVIPGVARIEVRVLSGTVSRVELTPTPMTGLASKHPPVADLADRSASDPQYFEGNLWLMAMGSWEVHVRVVGPLGEGELPVPVPALAFKSRPMDRPTTYFLIGMMVFLATGIVAIVGAAVREARLAPGTPAGGWNVRSLGWMAFTAILVGGALVGGNAWWADDAANFERRMYKPLTVSATPTPEGKLAVRLTDPGWIDMRKLDDLVPDHGHVVHLFLVRWPDLDQIFHLHPEQRATGMFEANQPPLPAGDYRLYADIVHESGLAETAVGTVTLPTLQGAPLTGDDSGGAASATGDSFPLGDGYRMVWRRNGGKSIVSRAVELYTFSIEGPDGSPVTDLEPYMGMGGHAEFVKKDGFVFAHVHPSGSVSMASEQIASSAAMMGMHQMNPGPEVSFPFGVPTAGSYRIFVQMKRAGKVQTAAFDFEAK